MGASISPFLSNRYVRNCRAFLLDLWIEGAPGRYCTGSTETAPVATQLECQAYCYQNSDCVGIIYNHEIGYTDICGICTDDQLKPAGYGFGFYSRPGKV